MCNRFSTWHNLTILLIASEFYHNLIHGWSEILLVWIPKTEKKFSEKWQPSGQHSYFTLRKPLVKITAWWAAILTEVFQGSPQSFQANARIV
jgi:hypothetical protein